MRQSGRRLEAYKETSTFDEKEKREMDLAIQKEEERKQKKLREQAKIKKSFEYRLVEITAFAMDKCFLDPIIGFFMPGFGDVITSLTALPSLYVSLFVVRSIPLTLAVISNVLVDALIGLIPFIGDIVDIFYRSNVKNYTLITGFVEDDKEIIKKVNRRAIWIGLFIILMGYLLYRLWLLLWGVISWMSGVIHSLF